ncbi:MAG: DUF1841 family protein [Hydrogenophilus sp.]|nr:DUF1841 family protein [Hydrogenophilus sp.]
MLFQPSRDEVRRFLAESFRRWRDALPLDPIQARAAEVIALHPEYFPLLTDEAALFRDYTPADGGVNPFLHLTLHFAVAEQLAIDHPPGICALYAERCVRRGDPHEALHDLVEALGITLYEAQRSGLPPDNDAYLEQIRKLR